MTKVVFEVGMLGFFVSAVYFGTQGMVLMDMVLRSFIVFIAIVLGQTVVFVAITSMKNTKKADHEKPLAEPRHPVTTEASETQPTTPS
jgi:hypothetical protein